MLRLKATLVATTLMRPWRTGWSEDRGVDFSLAAAARPATAVPTARGDTAPAEPSSFLDDDQTVARSFTSPAATGATIESRGEIAPDTTTGMRAWWTLSGKPSRT
jgi:hypothetical protein